MSGFEIAGIVLSSIPLLVSALERYGDGVRTIQKWRKYESEVRSVIRNLKTERVKLLNVCEKLLGGLVPASKVDVMVENPFGELWQEKGIQSKIRIRLWRSWDAFEDTVNVMKTAIDHAMEKLNDGSKPKTWWMESSSVMRELKRVAFTLRRSAYTELLATIRDGVSSLESLTNLSIELEPKRRSRSDVRFLSILRGLSSSVHRAVSSSLECACKHRMLMRLSSWPTDITPEQDEEEIIQDLKFHLALSTGYTQSAATATQQEQLIESSQAFAWEEILLHSSTEQSSMKQYAAPDSPATLQIPLEEEGWLDKIERPSPPVKTTRKRVKFASFESNIMVAASKVSTFHSAARRNGTVCLSEERSLVANLTSKMAIEVTTSGLCSPRSTLDLCGRLKKASTCRVQIQQETVGCYGVVLDPEPSSTTQSRRRYSVYPVPKQELMAGRASDRQIVSLRDVLEGRDGLPPLGYRHRLQLAVFVARSVLQFYKTAWMPETPSSRNIFFFVHKMNKRHSTYEHTFVMAENSDTAQDRTTKIVPIIHNPTLLALGVLLIELDKNKTLDSMRVSGEHFDGAALGDTQDRSVIELHDGQEVGM